MNGAKLVAALTFMLFWLVCAVGPTIAVVWVALHFIRKFW